MQKARSHRAGGFQYLKPYKRYFESGYRRWLLTGYHWLLNLTIQTGYHRLPIFRLELVYQATRFETTVLQKLPHLQNLTIITIFERTTGHYFAHISLLLVTIGYQPDLHPLITGYHRLLASVTSPHLGRLPATRDKNKICSGYRTCRPLIQIQFTP